MPTPEELVAVMREGLSALVAEAALRNSNSLGALHERVLRGEEHPDAPHPDARWRYRSRRVFERLREYMLVWSLPWHHEETWFWVARTAAGVDWVETEIVKWEKHVERHERLVARRKRDLDETTKLNYVYVDGDEFLFASENENK